MSNQAANPMPVADGPAKEALRDLRRRKAEAEAQVKALGDAIDFLESRLGPYSTNAQASS